MKNFFSKLKSGLHSEGASGAALTALIIGITVFVNAVIYTLGTVFGWYAYSPETLDLTLSDAPAEIFERAVLPGDEVTILFCQAEDDLKNHRSGGYVYQTAKQMAEKFSFLHVEYKNIVIDPDAVEPYKKDMKGNDTALNATSVVFIHNEQYRVLTDTTSGVGYVDFYTLNDKGTVVAYNGEEVLTAMILWVLREEHPTAYFTTGHTETSTAAFSSALACAGYYVDTVDLRQNEVPSDAGLLVISHPIKDFERSAEGSGVRSEYDRLVSYTDRGGRVLLVTDPYLKENQPVLRGFMDTFGISLSERDTDGGRVADIVKDTENGISVDGFTFVCDFGTGSFASSVAALVDAQAAGKVITSSSGVLLTDAAKGAEPLLVSSSAAETEAAGAVTDRDGRYTVAAYSRQTHNGNTAELVVLPSIYLSDSDAMVTNGYANRTFFYAVFSALGTGGGECPYGCRLVLMSNDYLENLTMGTARRLTVLFMAVPAALAVAGAVVVIRRKNR